MNSDMNDDASIFWENVQKEVKTQNTTQEWLAKNSGINFNTLHGWISKGIFPRVNEAIRIAASLNTSVEYLTSGSVQNNNKSIETIRLLIPAIQEQLKTIEDAVKEIR